jgi:hypothetical protein
MIRIQPFVLINKVKIKLSKLFEIEFKVVFLSLDILNVLWKELASIQVSFFKASAHV